MTTSRATRTRGRSAASRIASVLASASSWTPGFAGTTETCFPSTAKFASFGGLATRAPRCWSHSSAAWPPSWSVVRPPDGSSSSCASRYRGHDPAGLAEHELNRRRERDARLARGARERGGPNMGLLRAKRQRHRARQRGRARRARRRACARLRRLSSTDAGLGRHDDEGRAVADERGVARLPVDALRDLIELVLQRAVQDGRRRRDVGAEEGDVEALEPAERAESAALPLRRVDCGLPVRLDAELCSGGSGIACRRR